MFCQETILGGLQLKACSAAAQPMGALTPTRVSVSSKFDIVIRKSLSVLRIVRNHIYCTGSRFNIGTLHEPLKLDCTRRLRVQAS